MHYEYSIRPFLIRSLRSGKDRENDIIDVLHFLEDLGFKGRLQLIEFSILLQIDYDSIELIQITFPDVECREVEFLTSTVH